MAALPYARTFFYAALASETDECIVWPFSRDAKGYAMFALPGYKSRRGHRLIYQIATGETLGHEELVMHSCDNPPCLNPRHLSKGTNADNLGDMVRKGRSHHGQRHYMTRLSEDQARQVRELRRRGVPSTAVAEQFGISASSVRSIASGETWKHLAAVGKEDK